MNIVDINLWGLAAAYLLLVFPLGIILWLRIPLLGQTFTALARMTLQLLFVGFYLQLIFDRNSPWLTGIWILGMVIVADVSIARGCKLHLRRMAAGLFFAMLVGALIPLLFLLFVVLQDTSVLAAQYIIPIAGMILGNCLRANIIGLSHFYQALHDNERLYQLTLAQGATLKEALAPFARDACQAALAPTVATISTVGLVSLPGMMTGVILGGGNPMTAIKYQLVIMIAIFSGTALTVLMAILLTTRNNFTVQGTLKKGLFHADR